MGKDMYKQFVDLMHFPSNRQGFEKKYYSGGSEF